MLHRTKTKKNTKTSVASQALESWRALRGMLIHKGPKNVVDWQKRGRKDRSVV